MSKEIKPTFFETQGDFRAWLAENHQSQMVLYVGFYKVSSKKASMSWSQSVDEALCFGWIDGLRKSIDAESYFIRFSPRKPNSIWSAVNIQKVAELSEKGLMQAAGIASFALRKEEKSKIYAYEKEDVSFPIAFENEFKSNEKAWLFFQSLPPSYQRTATNWVISAKQEATRLKRLAELIQDSEAERKIKSLNYNSIKHT